MKKTFEVCIFIMFLCFLFNGCKQDVLSVLDAQIPVITFVSSDVNTNFNKSVVLTVEAANSDGGKLSYQWYSVSENKLQAGEPVINESSGSNLNSFLPDVSKAGIFYYYCVITNTLGDSSKSIISPRITVTVSEMVNARVPVITLQPQNIKSIVPADVIMTIGAASIDGGELTFKWYQLDDDAENYESATLINDATTASLKLISDLPCKTGYYCEVTNTIVDNGDGGIKTASVKSEIAYFESVYLKDTLNSPVFTKQPASLNIANPSVTLSCEAVVPNGYTTLYRWYKTEDGEIDSGEAVMEGWSSSAKFETPAFSEKGIYYYYCRAASYIPDENSELDEVTSCSNIVSVAYTGLPTLYLNTGDVPTSEITRDAYVQGSFKMVSQEYGVQEYTFTKEKEGIKGRGNASWNVPKKGYNIKFDKKQTFFNLPSSKKYCIVANWYDTTLMNNSFASYLAENIFNSEWTPHFNYVDVIMNGEYMGNYIFCEKIGISDGRLEIQDISDVENYLQKDKLDKIQDVNDDGVKNIEDGGFIIEVDYRGDAEIAFKTNKGVFVTLKDPDEVSSETLSYVESVINSVEDALYDDSFADLIQVNNTTISKWMSYFDVDSIIDWYIINEFSKQLDSTFITSVYLYYNPSDKKIHLGPIWDFDRAFGNWSRDPFDGELPTGWYTRRPDGMLFAQPVNWIARMAEDDLFNELVKNRWNEKKNSLRESINQAITSFSTYIQFSAEYNFVKWETIVPNPTYKESWSTEINNLIDWCNERYIWFDENINAF